MFSFVAVWSPPSQSNFLIAATTKLKKGVELKNLSVALRSRRNSVQTPAS